MGEEKKPEEDKPKEEEPKKNEQPKKEGEAPAAEAAAPPPPPPPPPPPEEVEMRVFMHCEGCARKVRRSLKGFDGVEEVMTDCRTHKVVVKGKKAAEDPLKVVERVQKKTGRKVELLSPLPPPPPPSPEEKPKAEEKKEEPVVIAVVLKVHMHCEACAQEIKKRILRMEGVQSAEPDLKASNVTVKGVFDPPKLVKYIHKRTRKHASIIKAEPINKKPEDEKAKEEGKGKEEKKEGNKAEGGDNKASEGDGKAKEEEKNEDEKKVDDKVKGDKAEKEGKNDAKDEKEKKELSPEEMAVAAAAAAVIAAAAKMEQKRNEFYYYYPTVPKYPVDYVAAYSAYAPTQSQPQPQPQGAYAPQIFSDENPNACSIM